MYVFYVLKSVASTGSMKKTPKQHQADLSEMNSVESSPATTPVHQMQNECMPPTISSSFNSMDLQSPSNRNLSEKELRDCDVIGTYWSPLKNCYNILNLSICLLTLTFLSSIVYRKIDQIIFLHCEEIYSRQRSKSYNALFSKFCEELLAIRTSHTSI